MAAFSCEGLPAKICSYYAMHEPHGNISNMYVCLHNAYLEHSSPHQAVISTDGKRLAIGRCSQHIQQILNPQDKKSQHPYATVTNPKYTTLPLVLPIHKRMLDLGYPTDRLTTGSFRHL